jgi:hypothetical protein
MRSGHWVALRSTHWGALLNARSTAGEGPPTGTPCSRFAGAALSYERLVEAALQIHLWPAAATWRAALASAG